jgi:hypothetical protein
LLSLAASQQEAPAAATTRSTPVHAYQSLRAMGVGILRRDAVNHQLHFLLLRSPSQLEHRGPTVLAETRIELPSRCVQLVSSPSHGRRSFDALKQTAVTPGCACFGARLHARSHRPSTIVLVHMCMRGAVWPIPARDINARQQTGRMRRMNQAAQGVVAFSRQ